MRFDLRVLSSTELTVNFGALRSLTIARTGGRKSGWLRATFRRKELLGAVLAGEFVEALEAALQKADALVHDLTCLAEVPQEESANTAQEIRLTAKVETPHETTLIETIARSALPQCRLLEALSRAGAYRVSLSVHCFTATDKIHLF